jgi:hypothetical protein
MRDALKFDDVPDMTWDRKVQSDAVLDNVRLGVTAVEMQKVADLLHCMLPTPKILDLVWGLAGVSGTQFEAVIRTASGIVANSDIHATHLAVEAALAKAGGDVGGFVEAVGKYWVLSNSLVGGRFGAAQAINYGWFTRSTARSPSVTGKARVWQSIGTRHTDDHYDPSQVIRLMRRDARLRRAGSNAWEDVDLADIARSKELAPLISHEGALKIVRMPRVPEPKASTDADGTLVLPPIYIIGSKSRIGV